MNIAKQEDDLAKYLYAVLDEFQQHPSLEGIDFLIRAEQSLWRKPKNKNELLAMVFLWCNKGYYQRQFGQSLKAISSYEKASQLYDKERLEGYDIIEFCKKPLGNLYTQIGDYGQAESTIKQYLLQAEKERNIPHIISGTNNLAIVYQSRGQFSLAIDLLNAVIDRYPKKAGANGDLFNNLAVNYIAINEYGKAVSNATKAVEIYKEFDSTTTKLVNAYKNLSLASVHQGRMNKAAVYFNAAADIALNSLEIAPRELAKIRLEEATILMAQNRLEEAKQRLHSALKILIPKIEETFPDPSLLYPETTLVDILDFYAQLFRNEQEYEKALQAYDLSFVVEDLLREQHGYEASKFIQQINNRNRSERCIAILFEFLNEQIGWEDRALHYAEKSKSILLREQLLRDHTIAQLRDEKLVQENILLSQRLANVNNALILEQLKGDMANLSRIQELLQSKNEVALRIKEFNETLRSEFPSMKDQFDISQLKTKIKEDDLIFIEYFFGRDAIYQFVVDERMTRIQKIERTAELEHNLQQFIRYFDKASNITNDIVGFKNASFSIYKQLLVNSFTNKHKLIIIPDGILSFIPFEVLLTQVTDELQFEALPYILKEHQIIYNYSANFYLDEAKGRVNKDEVLGVFPVFENTNQPLMHSLNEAKMIANEMHGRFLRREEASKQHFERLARSFDILHLSTHANAGSNSIPASIQFFDQTLLLPELQAIEMNPKLVVLSACETGIGKLEKGEGPMSIARGFKASGAENLLFSLWKVNDMTTAQWMGKFYRSYARSHSANSSAHQSKLAYLSDETISNAKKSPYYWGSFVFYGQIEPQNNKLIWVISLGIILIMVILWLISNKNGFASKVFKR
ncbi:CHAT domain-containing protein [Sungkyunkwania multivorans]|uniref:CHAT domain-containing protein n=1 Tax=Sungkyunkwania multivorans TaxID=1173618 RepID=A0ABW3CWP3_9FLAO